MILTGKLGNRVTNSYLVSRELYLAKKIKAKNKSKFVLSIGLRKKGREDRNKVILFFLSNHLGKQMAGYIMIIFRTF